MKRQFALTMRIRVSSTDGGDAARRGAAFISGSCIYYAIFIHHACIIYQPESIKGFLKINHTFCCLYLRCHSNIPLEVLKVDSRGLRTIFVGVKNILKAVSAFGNYDVIDRHTDTHYSPHL